MCGIAGIVSAQPGPPRDLAAALGVLAPRGPDDEGTWRSPGGRATLGHRRLSIVDLSEAGRQPLANEDGTLQLVCNGEIYNAPVLRGRLVAKGHRFRSSSDSEVILHAFEEWGADSLERLHGMFAFALWDDSAQLLLLARDRIGIKPLVYAEVGGTLCFASTSSALLELLETSPEPDPGAIAHLLAHGYVPAPHCIWEGVRKLEPATSLTWRAAPPVPRLQRYWQPPAETRADASPDTEWPELFARVLREHLLADVPLGLFLSAGLDSSSLALGLHDLGERPGALTMTFSGSDDESPLAAETAARLGLSHQRPRIDPGRIDDLLDETMAAYDEPQAYGALLTMKAICRPAAESFKAVFAGDGGDEVFGGYRWHEPPYGRDRRIARGLRPLLRRIARRQPGTIVRNAILRQFSRASALHRHARRVSPRFLPEEIEFLLSSTGLRYDDERMLAPLAKHCEAGLPPRRARQRIDLMTFCSDSILPKVDRASMAHGLEIRVPFLDHRIVEWGLSLPEQPGEPAKEVLRRYLRGRVPGEVLKRPKQGFSLRAMAGYDWEEAGRRIDRSPLVRLGLLRSDWRRATEPGVHGRHARLWALRALAAWTERWL